MSTVEMWFDPVCPWAWVASRWLLEVERVREVHVTFQIMSLSALNEAVPGLSARERAYYGRAWGPVRVAMLTSMIAGQAAVRRLYAAMGHLIHVEHVRVGRDLYARSLHAAGLPPSYANAAATDVYDAEIRRSHYAGVDALGDTAACPVLHPRDATGEPVPMVGPLLSRPPRGEAAGRLWDSVALAADTPEFVELRRPALVDAG